MMMVNGGYGAYNTNNAGNNRKITVSGEGIVYSAPNRATATVGVRTENPNLQAAQTENAEKSTSMLNSLQNLGIAKDDIKTADFRIDPIYTYEEGKQLFQGYRVTHLYTVTIRNLAQAGLAIDTAVANGANEVMNIQFSVAEPQALYNQALSIAVIDSYNKAQTIARTLGFHTSISPLSITEETQKGSPGPFLVASMDTSSAKGTPIEPGKLEIKATVTGTYIT
ncbi:MULTISPECIES: SIMPL domain-containing protein [unclassified Mesobacillus]|uniref:SIMPL domain-containing protein n=1 Tax=unclassified Mesobacillus TaxID=2675270 RepID=UPI00203B47DD|nr:MULTISPECIES: SIMPL domain-containing protein [unclassified Mesobacillus]MCM3122362.1 SIMPL domain-containing protein [Mesobacillus sp. MER 33]MCM3232326.1 SIMPL domain-containing protein [Mesobacillus sp. MER 48]